MAYSLRAFSELYGLNVTEFDGSKLLASAVSSDNSGHYFDVLTWSIVGDNGALSASNLKWLTGTYDTDPDHPYENRSTESIMLPNGDVVVTYWGYTADPITNSTNTSVSMNLNAQVVRTDGTISEPLVIGRAGFEHSHQPFAVGDDSFGVAWDGKIAGGQEGTNVSIFNNNGKKIGSYFNEQDNYLVQGSADSEGNILLTFIESSGSAKTQVLQLEPNSLGLFEAKIVVGNGEARAEVSSISLPDSSPSLSGTVEWSSDGKIIATIPADEGLGLTEDLIGKSLSAKIYALNAIGDSTVMEIKSSEVVEALDTNIFVPLLSKKASDQVIALPENFDSSTNISYLHAHHDAGFYTYTQGGQRKFIIPGNKDSHAILGDFDFGWPQEHDIIQTDNNGYVVTYESGNGIYLAKLNDSLELIGSAVQITPSSRSSTKFF